MLVESFWVKLDILWVWKGVKQNKVNFPNIEINKPLPASVYSVS